MKVSYTSNKPEHLELHGLGVQVQITKTLGIESQRLIFTQAEETMPYMNPNREKGVRILTGLTARAQKLAGKAVDIVIDGKTFTVNKNSFIKFCQRINRGLEKGAKPIVINSKLIESELKKHILERPPSPVGLPETEQREVIARIDQMHELATSSHKASTPRHSETLAPAPLIGDDLRDAIAQYNKAQNPNSRQRTVASQQSSDSYDNQLRACVGLSRSPSRSDLSVDERPSDILNPLLNTSESDSGNFNADRALEQAEAAFLSEEPQDFAESADQQQVEHFKKVISQNMLDWNDSDEGVKSNTSQTQSEVADSYEFQADPDILAQLEQAALFQEEQHELMPNFGEILGDDPLAQRALKQQLLKEFMSVQKQRIADMSNIAVAMDKITTDAALRSAQISVREEKDKIAPKRAITAKLKESNNDDRDLEKEQRLQALLALFPTPEKAPTSITTQQTAHVQPKTSTLLSVALMTAAVATTAMLTLTLWNMKDLNSETLRLESLMNNFSQNFTATQEATSQMTQAVANYACEKFEYLQSDQFQLDVIRSLFESNKAFLDFVRSQESLAGFLKNMTQAGYEMVEPVARGGLNQVVDTAQFAAKHFYLYPQYLSDKALQVWNETVVPNAQLALEHTFNATASTLKTVQNFFIDRSQEQWIGLNTSSPLDLPKSIIPNSTDTTLPRRLAWNFYRIGEWND